MDDPVCFVVCYHMKCQEMGAIAKNEFVTGCTLLHCESIENWRREVGNMRGELQNMSKFPDIYLYLFTMALEPGFKTANIDTSIALWEMFLTEKCKYMKQWIAFIQNEQDGGMKAISKDTWEMIWELIKQTNGNMKNFVDDGTWPSIIDRFVSFVG